MRIAQCMLCATNSAVPLGPCTCCQQTEASTALGEDRRSPLDHPPPPPLTRQLPCRGKDGDHRGCEYAQDVVEAHMHRLIARQVEVEREVGMGVAHGVYHRGWRRVTGGAQAVGDRGRSEGASVGVWAELFGGQAKKRVGMSRVPSFAPAPPLLFTVDPGVLSSSSLQLPAARGARAPLSLAPAAPAVPHSAAAKKAGDLQATQQLAAAARCQPERRRTRPAAEPQWQAATTPSRTHPNSHGRAARGQGGCQGGGGSRGGAREGARRRGCGPGRCPCAAAAPLAPSCRLRPESGRGW
jgi:hypothetical protein